MVPAASCGQGERQQGASAGSGRERGAVLQAIHGGAQQGEEAVSQGCSNLFYSGCPPAAEAHIF